MGSWFPERLSSIILLQGRSQNDLPRISCPIVEETVVQNRLFSLTAIVVLPLRDLDRILSFVLFRLWNALARSLVAALRDEVLDPLQVRAH